jgi:hypothetical protein
MPINVGKEGVARIFGLSCEGIVPIGRENYKIPNCQNKWKIEGNQIGSINGDRVFQIKKQV